MSTEAFPEASFEAAVAAANAAVDSDQSAVPAVEAPAPESQPAQATASAAAPGQAGAGAPSGAAPIPQYILDREAALDARERAAREMESKVRIEKDRLSALEAREQAVAKATEEFEVDPVGFARKLRPDLTPAQAAKWAEQFYAHALGKEAPVEVRLEQKIAEIDRNAKQANERLSKQLEEQQRQAAEAQRTRMVTEYQAQLKASASTLAADVAPYLSNLAKTDPDQFASELLVEARRDCERQYAANPEVEPVPPATEELIKRAEARVKATVERYGAGLGAPAAQAQKSAPELTNRTTAHQPPHAAIDPDDDRALRAAALKAAGAGHIPVW